MHSNELESSCEALNLMAEDVHTSLIFPQRQGGPFVDKTRPREVFVTVVVICQRSLGSLSEHKMIFF